MYVDNTIIPVSAPTQTVVDEPVYVTTSPQTVVFQGDPQLGTAMVNDANQLNENKSLASDLSIVAEIEEETPIVLQEESDLFKKSKASLGQVLREELADGRILVVNRINTKDL